jgi:protein-L-isoaspartate(D-aspartate) O-methyltransferase
VIVTVGAADIPPAWLEQLTRDGRIVVPLRLRGLFRLFLFERGNGHLVSRDVKPYGFVSIRGAGAVPQRTVRLGGEHVRLIIDDRQPADADALTASLSCPREQAWTGVSLDTAEGRLPSLDLWLASALDTYGRVHADSDAVDRGLVGLTLPAGSSATWHGATLAYITVRAATGPGGTARYELGASAHGPDRARLATRLAEQVRAWDRDVRSGPGPTVRAYPAGTPDALLAKGRVVERRHARYVISYS